MTAGQDLVGQLTALHPGARLSWRQIGAVPESPEYPKCATAGRHYLQESLATRTGTVSGEPAP